MITSRGNHMQRNASTHMWPNQFTDKNTTGIENHPLAQSSAGGATDKGFKLLLASHFANKTDTGHKQNSDIIIIIELCCKGRSDPVSLLFSTNVQSTPHHTPTQFEETRLGSRPNLRQTVGLTQRTDFVSSHFFPFFFIMHVEDWFAC